MSPFRKTENCCKDVDLCDTFPSENTQSPPYPGVNEAAERYKEVCPVSSAIWGTEKRLCFSLKRCAKVLGRLEQLAVT